ncbi:AIPR family protein, partial [Enterococcus sp. DIV1271a]
NNTSLYNKEVKRLYRNALDRLNDENVGNIEVVFSSLSKFNEEKVNTKLFSMGRFSELTFLDEKEIEKMIGEIRDNLPVVSEYKFSLDRTNNYLEYKSDYYEGVVVNIDAHSLKSAYEKYEKDGLFNLNIRRYIKSKAVDDAIINTIIKDSDNFWFLNNGITVACDDFIIDGDKIKIYDFSIVNGGQTTTLISQKINDKIQNFYIMCKIIKKISTSKESNNIQFFNKIAESTNSQKPIQPRDLKSNAPEMISLQSLLKEKGYFLEIKRGVSAPRKFANKKIKNEDFAQIYFSFVCQKPGTSRSNKKSLFSNNTNYKTIFQQKFRKKPEKIDFITNLIDLNQYIDEAILSLKNVGDNTLD